MLDTLAAIPDDRRLELARVLPAPRELVWTMFSDPYHLSRWWGPEGFTNLVIEMEFREGGRWHHVMRGPDGKDYPIDSVFIEVTPPERIVYRNAAADPEIFGDNPPPSFIRVITLTDIGNGRTRLTLDAYFDTAANKDAIIRRGFRQGTEQSLDKLAAHLLSLGGTK
ncbi:SRPBCC domain-containing protein [Devosia sp.]|uniref:SRPBCC domain-containing protein n=1 Tax=Devosia sp. TaxID=1871048 RepID=UPI001AC4E2C6|nr:SRPBCC domain-containing protein [Devosia sp.]MBN9308599.1 SRPBCC domain-containing protein [Devosia sp.]